MGVESYGVQFKPTGGGGAEVLTVEQVEETMVAAGFQRLPLRTEYNPALLAAPPVGETEYERRDSESVIEALIRWEAEPGHPSRTDSLPVTSVAVRFAVGQPAAAEEQFLAVIEALMRAHPLSVADGLPQKGTAGRIDRPFDSSLRVRLRSDIAALRANWRRLFPGNVPEIPLSSAEAWTYYLQKQTGKKEKP